MVADRTTRSVRRLLLLFLIAVIALGLFASFQIVKNPVSTIPSQQEADLQSETLDTQNLPSYPGLLSPKPNYSSLKHLAISLSFPLFDSGRRAYPASFTGGGDIDRALASRQYYEAKARAESLALGTDNQIPPSSVRNFADCGAFVATVVINTIDPDYPGLFVYKQRHYVQNKSNGWRKVGTTTKPLSYTPKIGDIFISNAETRSGHTWIWLGDVDGKRDVIADASYSSDESSTARLPGLRISPLVGKTEDTRGREYDIWRFVG